jgi:16S rRNA (guanine527-N7)-methyltransferase
MNAATLAEGAAALGRALSSAQRDQLLAFVGLLDHWNRTYNLTAIREPERMLTHHVLDSLAAAPWVRGPRVLDVGSGGGLPGVPLAIADPSLRVTLLDSNSKKTAFLAHAVGALSLPNVEVVTSRVEAYAPPAAFDTVISRAFSDLRDFVSRTGLHVAADGRWVAMKGLMPHEELAQLDATVTLDATHAVTVPGVDGQRHVLVLRRSTVGAPTTAGPR